MDIKGIQVTAERLARAESVIAAESGDDGDTRDFIEQTYTSIWFHILNERTKIESIINESRSNALKFGRMLPAYQAAEQRLTTKAHQGTNAELLTAVRAARSAFLEHFPELQHR